MDFHEFGFPLKWKAEVYHKNNRCQPTVWEAAVPVHSLNSHLFDFPARSLWHSFIALMALLMEVSLCQNIFVLLNIFLLIKL